MVGQGTEIAKIIASFVDKPYRLLETDCATIIYKLYGDKLLSEWEGVTWTNFPEKFKNIHEEGIKFFISFIKANTKQVTIPSFGDIVIINDDLVGIYVGNRMMLTSLVDKGVKIIPVPKAATYWRLDG